MTFSISELIIAVGSNFEKEVPQVRDARDGIAAEIKKRGYKQAAIAKMVNLTEQQLCDILKKRRKLDANEMFRICEVIGVDPNYLFAVAQDPA